MFHGAILPSGVKTFHGPFGDVDIVVLLSGDGDFDLLLEKIRKDHHIRTEVYGVKALTANSLINAASLYHRIDEGLLL